MIRYARIVVRVEIQIRVQQQTPELMKNFYFNVGTCHIYSCKSLSAADIFYFTIMNTNYSLCSVAVINCIPFVHSARFIWRVIVFFFFEQFLRKFIMSPNFNHKIDFTVLHVEYFSFILRS